MREYKHAYCSGQSYSSQPEFQSHVPSENHSSTSFDEHIWSSSRSILEDYMSTSIMLDNMMMMMIIFNHLFVKLLFFLRIIED